MSVRTLSGTRLKSRSVSEAQAPQANPIWVRPTDWVFCPDIGDTEQKFQGVYGVSELADNYCCFAFTGAYRVNWGDGTEENVASGVQASHTFNYATCRSDVCSLGYKTVLITVTPQAGHNLVTMDLHKKHANITRSTYADMWLELKINAEHLTSINSPHDKVVLMQNVEAVSINKNACSSLDRLCSSFYSLRSFKLGHSSACTSASGMFASCSALTTVPLFDLSSCTDVTGMFGECPALTSVPLFDLSSCLTTAEMFGFSTALVTVPLFDLSSCTDTNGMFANCYALTSVPLFDLSSCLDASYMFYNCYALTSVPLFDLSSCTDTSYMLNGCYALTSVPLFNLSSCTSTQAMFYYCKALITVPLFDLSECLDVSAMFSHCFALKSVPQFDVSKATQTYNMFYNCFSVVHIPALNLNASVSSGGIFFSCYALTKVLSAPKVSFNVDNCNLSAAALNALYAILPTVTGKMLSVAGNPGVSSDDPSIATAKGWTVA
jgi:hypothetical protein